MNLKINGRNHETSDGLTLSQLLLELKVKPPLAVELNRQVCPKRFHNETQLKDGDELEIVTIVGGG